MRECTCTDCRDGEHENYDDDIDFVIVRDPDAKGGGFVKKGYMCASHIEMYESDGFEVKSVQSVRKMI